MDKDLKLRIKEFFEKSENETIGVVYVTADANIFKAEHYAKSWAASLIDKAYVIATREQYTKAAALKVVKTEDDVAGGDPPAEDKALTDENKRSALVELYIELFDTKPAADVSDEDLQKLIEEKQAVSVDKKVIDEKAEKEALKAKYVELFGKQPVGKSYDKIKTEIAEKEAGSN